MKQYIIEIKSLLDELKIGYINHIGNNTGTFIPAATIVRLYILNNKIFNKRDQPSRCPSCIINLINGLIDYLNVNDKKPIKEIIIDQN